MYSYNKEPNNNNKPMKHLYIDKANIMDSIKDMVRTGESNVGFMIEVVLANWPNISYKRAQEYVLQAITEAKNN